LDAFRPDDGLLSAIREAGTSQHHLWLGSMCIGAQLGAASSYSVFEVIGVKDRRSTGDWYGAVSIDVAAKYLGEQIALALGQRASGENATTIREILSLALSVFR